MGERCELRCHQGGHAGEARVAPQDLIGIAEMIETTIVEVVAAVEAVVGGMSGKRDNNLISVFVQCDRFFIVRV